MDDSLNTMRMDDYSKVVYIGSSSVIGKRSGQQDCIKSDDFYTFLERKKAIAVLCDGMGGLTGGEKASMKCSSVVYDSFHKQESIDSIPEFFRYVISEADNQVRFMKDDDGQPIVGSGTTLASVAINDDGMYWASVGDSRIYIIRDNKILCITDDHNLQMLLNEEVKKGLITQKEADNNSQKEALVSFIGMGGVRFIDMNNKPFSLKNGDYIIICSDGLYRSLSIEEMKAVVLENGLDTQGAADALTALVTSKDIINQDNTSVIVIAYQDSG